MKYRPDIDGLRALAVLPVVFYHGNIFPFGGGFTGVDVFFVISGYLITKIIAGDLEAGHFSLRDFYERRVRRILPALLLMMGVVMVAGYLVLLPDEYKALAESAIHGVLFASNVFFTNNTGYFDGAASDMPLLHTWSLAIEEQFYLFWPLILMGLWRFARPRKALFWSLIAIGAAVSFGISVYGVSTNAKDAFYLLPSRAWELLLGCALALAGTRPFEPLHRFANPLALIGISLIGWGVFVLTREDSFPGYNAVFPCLGAALIILTGALRETVVHRALSISPLVFVGKISYSLYLWHWPVFVFYRLHTNAAALSSREAAALIAISAALAVLSWWLVELPARRSTRGWRVHFAYAAACMAVVGISAILVDEHRGVPGRLPPDLAQLSSKEAMWEWKCPQTLRIAGLPDERGLCIIGAPWDRATTKGILWGDSHAEHFAPVLDPVARDANVSLVLWRRCPAYIDNQQVKRLHWEEPRYSEWCGQSHAQAIEWLHSNPSIDLVVLAAAWLSYPESLYDQDRGKRSTEQGIRLMRLGMDNLIQKIDPATHRILIISDVPRPPVDIANCLLMSQGGFLGRRCNINPGSIDAASVRKRHAPTNGVLQDVATRWGVDLVLVTDRMCGEQTCPTNANGEFLYRDGSHLRRDLSEQTRRKLAGMIGLGAAFKSIE